MDRLQRNTGTVYSMYKKIWKLTFRATLENLLLLQSDKALRGRVWNQEITEC